jgi:predicted nucleic acid-binding protein
MTVVIADTSPINYLVLIKEIEVLPRLYQRVVVPSAVLDELMNAGAPPGVREWASRKPEWLEVWSVPGWDASLADLDDGEASAIALAQLESEVLLLIDETAGRLEASRRKIPNTGTLGVLRAGAIGGLVDLPSALRLLQATNFRVSKTLVAELIAEDTDRRRG